MPSLMDKNHHARNICIVGNISSGKSTLTHLLAQHIPNATEIPEEFGENPFLPLYLKEPRRWAFANATRYYYDYVRVFHERTAGQDDDWHFIDAGGETNRLVYGRYLLDEAIITRDEYEFYDLLCNVLQRAYAYPDPDAYIFVEASPETCHARMVRRGWEFQNRVRLDYLVRLLGYFTALHASVAQQGIPTFQISSEELDFTESQDAAHIVASVQKFLHEAFPVPSSHDTSPTLLLQEEGD